MSTPRTDAAKDWADALASNLHACAIISSRDEERVAKQAREHYAKNAAGSQHVSDVSDAVKQAVEKAVSDLWLDSPAHDKRAVEIILRCLEAALKAQPIAVTAETELRELREEEIESYLSRKMCCDGRECGCGGVTILQHLVLEEVGNQLIDLRQENSALQAREEKLVEALKAMNELATREGWNTPMFEPEFGSTLRASRAALLPQPTHEGKK